MPARVLSATTLSDENLTVADACTVAVSKSQRKREMHERQTLGETLIVLDPKHWAVLELPEVLCLALREARQIRAHGAAKRQRQYIGRLMREIDPAPITAYLARLRGGK